MKIKTFALMLALAATTWAQTVAPTTSDKNTPAVGSATCPCCAKTGDNSKDMPCCHGKEAKGEMACCSGGKGAKACMRAGHEGGSCCGKDAACCKDGASCCGKDTKESDVKGCCAGSKCDRRAHHQDTGL